jgi:prophage antirepressor-like protein
MTAKAKTHFQAAGKHVESIARKTRVWILLEDIQTRLGYHTHTRIEALQRLLQPTSLKQSPVMDLSSATGAARRYPQE